MGELGQCSDRQWAG